MLNINHAIKCFFVQYATGKLKMVEKAMLFLKNA